MIWVSPTALGKHDMEKTSPKSEFFSLAIDGAIARLSLANVAQANCLNDAFWAELPVLVRYIDQNPAIRVLVITGEGKHFCAGMDLSSFEFISDIAGGEAGRGAFMFYNRIRELQAAFDVLESSRLPIVAAVHGACIGGAIDFLCACDVRIAAKDTRFSVEEINVGMAADVGTLQRLPRLIPPGIAKELAFTGRRFGPDEALGWGFVNAVHEDRETTVAAAMELAASIASKSPLALAGTKRAINYAMDHSVADGLEQVATWNAGMLRPQDLNAALSALKEKRRVEFADLR